MGKPIAIKQHKFNGGVLSPLLYGDTTVPKYGASLRQCLNFLPIAQGALVSRPGTKYITDTYGDKPARLIPFIFNDGTAYVLEFTDLLMRVIQNGALVGAPFTLVTPWTAAMLPYLKYSQVGNVITICYGGQVAGTVALAPRDLTYGGSTSWALSTTQVQTVYGALSGTQPSSGGWGSTNPGVNIPIWTAGTYNSGDQVIQNGYYWIALKSTATQPPADYNATAQDWAPSADPSHTGGGKSGVYWLITATIQNQTTGVVFETGVGAQLLCKAVGRADFAPPPAVDRPVSVSFPTFTPPAGWSVLSYSIYKGMSYASALAGWVAYLSPANTTVDVSSNIVLSPWVDNGVTPNPVLQAPRDRFYGEPDGPFEYPVTILNSSYYAGNVGAFYTVKTYYPGVVAHLEQRRMFARSTSLPQTLWGSAVGNLYRFDRPFPGSEQDAVQYTLASEKLEEIRSLVGARAGLVMTGQGEWALLGAGGTAFTRTVYNFKRQSQWGSSWLDPIVIGTGCLFNTAKSNMIRDMYPLYGTYTDIWDGNDLSYQSRHLFDNHTIVAWAYQNTPYSVVWAVREDGALLSLTYYRTSQGAITEVPQPVVAWAQHSTGLGDIDAPAWDSGKTYETGDLVTYNSVTWQAAQNILPGGISPFPGSGFWTQLAQDGFVEGVCVVPEPPEDAVYLVVRRVVNGATVRYIERLGNVIPPVDLRYYLGLDASTLFDGHITDNTTGQLSGGTYLAQTQATFTTSTAKFAAADAGASAVILDPDVRQPSGVAGVRCRIVGYASPTVVTVEFDSALTASQINRFANAPSASWGLAKSVFNMPQLTSYPTDAGIKAPGGSRGLAALADGATVDPRNLLVVGASVTLPGGAFGAALVVQIGISYNCDAQLLDAWHPQAEIRNLQKSVVKAGFHVALARGVWAGKDFGTLYEWAQQQVANSWGPVPPNTGYFETEIGDDWNKDGGMCYRHFDPLPCQILGAVREVQLGGS